MKTVAKNTINPFDIIEELHCSLEAKDRQIRLLEEINCLLHHRFGSKSERSKERCSMRLRNLLQIPSPIFE
jgi:hypothetical protein